MKVCAISDVHCKWNKVTIPECDLLISAGDYSFLGEPHVIKDFHKWLNKQPVQHIISLQGNHEKGVEKNFELSKLIALEACPRVHFIEEGLVEIEGVRIWCSAIQPFFCNWAYNRYPGEDIQRHWDLIPNNLDIMVIHGPCHGILDWIPYFNNTKGEIDVRHVGCPQLLQKTLEIKPKAFICGHIHEAYGEVYKNGIHFINAAICDENYKAVNTPIVFEI